MSALATISAACACARTLIFESLRIDAFKGAIPHVMLVVDGVPCVQQKVLIEGYRQTLEEHNGNTDSGRQLEEAVRGNTYISLNPAALTPCGSSGLFALSEDGVSDPSGGTISYSIVPFSRFSFVKDVKHLQSFFRQCGAEAALNSSAEARPGAAPTRWSDEQFLCSLCELAPYLQPLPAQGGQPPVLSEAAAGDAEGCPLRRRFSREQAAAQATLLRGRNAPLRELLGVILIQRNAFQNALGQYRLRLSLFDRGLRVAEHAHLEGMSAAADALAGAGRPVEALADGQLRTYAQSCALRPDTAETVGKALADAIDGYAWRRRETANANDGDAAGEAAEASPPPPESLKSCLQNASVWELLKPGSIVWKGLGDGAVRTKPPEGYRGVLGDQPIIGVGEPLRIVSKGDSQHVLTFSGGMESCLMNTGHYPAAWEVARNDVHAHRLRFPSGADDAPPFGAEATTLRPSPASLMGLQQTLMDSSSTPETAGRGGMKKKEYLAMLKQKNQKPNKPPKIDSDDDEHTGITRRARNSSGPELTGSRISASIGGTFPIGEVISESFDLSKLNGTCEVFAFPNRFKHVALSSPKPFLMAIDHGRVTDVSEDAPDEFVDMLSLVRQSEGDCWVRELGIGLNPFLGPSNILSDVTSFERQWGIHLSLGKRHPLFVKQKAPHNVDASAAADVHVEGPVLKRKEGKYHIDVFVNVAKLTMGNLEVDFTKGVMVD